ncbi:MAG: glycosyltransferase family 4 protein, partial [Flavobacteriaceae bacterium]|nr:glycosyltransferase family 4 protein [Flavobacteriaceae bacterium]
MKNILISAYACNPSKGSEAGYGYHWASGLQKKGYNVVCLTRREGKRDIENISVIKNLHFEYLDLPFGLEKLYSLSRVTMYLHYLLWQWLAYRKAQKLHKEFHFEMAHHVTWGSLQLGSFVYKLDIPFVFGPAGGGQVAPVSFKKYFKEYWSVEVKRELTSKWLLRLNPAITMMLKKAKHVLVSNPETQMLAINCGAKNTSLILDTALPENFFPERMPFREIKDELKLLWIGRLLPRKGVLLVTEVMEQLKEYPLISLTIVGDGEMRNHLEQDIKDRGLFNVNFLGSVPYEEVKEHYAAHDLFFFTSLRDSGGVQLFEAMAYGLPIVTIKLHGQDFIVNDKVGIKCIVSNPKETVEALKNAIIMLFHDRQKLNNMSNAAFEYSRQQTWESQIDKVVADF